MNKAPLDHAKLKVTKSWATNQVWFAYESKEPISHAEMQFLQTQAGYMPMGYGFYNSRMIEQPDGTCLTTWSCNHSAD